MVSEGKTNVSTWPSNVSRRKTLVSNPQLEAATKTKVSKLTLQDWETKVLAGDGIGWWDLSSSSVGEQQLLS